MKKSQEAALKPKSAKESAVTMTQMVLPQHTNSLGAVFGGTLVSWVDIAAAIAVQRHTGRPCVTASIDELHFMKPINVGQVANIQAHVSAVHRTSCEVQVSVEGENTLKSERFHVAHAFLTFVALDDFGRPVEIPKLLLKTAEEKASQEQGLIRREQRVKLKKMLAAAEAPKPKI